LLEVVGVDEIDAAAADHLVRPVAAGGVFLPLDAVDPAIQILFEALKETVTK